MRIFEEGKVGELVGIDILKTELLKKNNIGSYRDIGPITLRIYKAEKKTHKIRTLEMFKEIAFGIGIEAIQKVVDFIHVTLYLHQGLYQSFRKPNDNPLYILPSTNPAI